MGISEQNEKIRKGLLYLNKKPKLNEKVFVMFEGIYIYDLNFMRQTDIFIILYLFIYLFFWVKVEYKMSMEIDIYRSN